MGSDRNLPSRSSSPADVQAFVAKLAATPTAKPAGQRGRLLFALDATASRQPTWDRATAIQDEMFVAADELGGIEVQLCFYRGFGEFRASPWLHRARDLVRMMDTVMCRAGRTQIAKVVQHAINETRDRRVDALAFVGDCMEEDIDGLAGLAGELGVLGVPAFMFHEGFEPTAVFAFKEIARLSGGAYCRFDHASADALKQLLRAVAVYAAGGQPALQRLAVQSGGAVLQIARQVERR